VLTGSANGRVRTDMGVVERTTIRSLHAVPTRGCMVGEVNVVVALVDSRMLREWQSAANKSSGPTPYRDKYWNFGRPVHSLTLAFVGTGGTGCESESIPRIRQ
jgi:hypothetical protein